MLPLGNRCKVFTASKCVHNRLDWAARPCRSVHTVGDGGDGHFGLVEVRVEALEHSARDHTVQFCHTVGVLREPQTEVCHVEAGGVVFRAKRHHFVYRNTRCELRSAILAGLQIAFDEVVFEAVDSCRYRGVRGEEGGCANNRQGSLPVFAFVHHLTDALHAEESCVTLVHVVHIRVRNTVDVAVALNGADAADAEHQLLLDAVLNIAAVETVGDDAEVLRV